MFVVPRTMVRCTPVPGYNGQSGRHKVVLDHGHGFAVLLLSIRYKRLFRKLIAVKDKPRFRSWQMWRHLELSFMACVSNFTKYGLIQMNKTVAHDSFKNCRQCAFCILLCFRFATDYKVVPQTEDSYNRAVEWPGGFQ